MIYYNLSLKESFKQCNSPRIVRNIDAEWQRLLLSYIHLLLYN